MLPDDGWFYRRPMSRRHAPADQLVWRTLGVLVAVVAVWMVLVTVMDLG